jgi:8-oxo-dGTP pyrophosphatase MutT (NUDIX family)
MQEYILIYAHEWLKEQIIFVEKDRPAWQAGRINLPGGKVEPGEDPKAAASREFEEETGIKLISWSEQPRFCGIIKGEWGTIHCFAVDLDAVSREDIDIKSREGETERFFWEDSGLYRHDKRCLPNLRLIIPLMSQNVTGWTIIDNNPDINRRPYTVQMELED